MKVSTFDFVCDNIKVTLPEGYRYYKFKITLVFNNFALKKYYRLKVIQ